MEPKKLEGRPYPVEGALLSISHEAYRLRIGIGNAWGIIDATRVFCYSMVTKGETELLRT